MILGAQGGLSALARVVVFDISTNEGAPIGQL
jgi:hypothetical protein